MNNAKKRTNDILLKLGVKIVELYHDRTKYHNMLGALVQLDINTMQDYSEQYTEYRDIVKNQTDNILIKLCV